MEGYEQNEIVAAIEVAGRQLGFKPRPKQLNFVWVRDIFVSLPTGSGKSLLQTNLQTC